MQEHNINRWNEGTYSATSITSTSSEHALDLMAEPYLSLATPSGVSCGIMIFVWCVVIIVCKEGGTPTTAALMEDHRRVSCSVLLLTEELAYLGRWISLPFRPSKLSLAPRPKTPAEVTNSGRREGRRQSYRRKSVGRSLLLSSIVNGRNQQCTDGSTGTC